MAFDTARRHALNDVILPKDIHKDRRQYCDHSTCEDLTKADDITRYKEGDAYLDRAHRIFVRDQKRPEELIVDLHKQVDGQ